MTATNIELARHNMVEQQIRPWDVLDQRVLEATARTPRENFVPTAYRHVAFADLEIPLGHDEMMLPPRLEGRMLQTLALSPNDTVLEVGTGSGYFTALLATLSRHVYSVERIPALRARAGRLLVEHHIDNVTLDEGNGAQGWPRRGSFDAIVLTGSVPVLTPALKAQLAPGGRLLAVVGREPAMEMLRITRVDAESWRTESLFETVIPPLRDLPEETALFTL